MNYEAYAFVYSAKIHQGPRCAQQHDLSAALEEAQRAHAAVQAEYAATAQHVLRRLCFGFGWAPSDLRKLPRSSDTGTPFSH